MNRPSRRMYISWATLASLASVVLGAVQAPVTPTESGQTTSPRLPRRSRQATPPLDLRVVGATSTQALLSYTAPSALPCSIEVSESRGFSPLVHDVNPGLFPGSNRDGGGELSRFFVIGKKTSGLAPDGKRYSRALQANTVHYYRLTCGAVSVPGTFTTTNIPVGKTFPEPLPLDKANPGQYNFPTLEPGDRDQTVVDPNTGALLRRVTLPGDLGSTRFWDASQTIWYDSGSFEACSKVPSNGGYHCAVPSDGGPPRMYWIDPASGAVRFLGVMYAPANGDSQNGWRSQYPTAVTALWDSQRNNVYYTLANTRSSEDPARKQILLMGTYTGGDHAVPQNTAAEFIWTNLTPGPEDTLSDLLARYNRSFDPAKFTCQARAVQGDYLVVVCRRYYQDSYGWVAVVHLGDRQPAGLERADTPRVIAAVPVWRQPRSRWCGIHSLNPAGDTPVAAVELQDLFGDGATGPYATTLTQDVNASSTTFVVAGEPTSANRNGDPFLMGAAVGDRFLVKGSGGEETVTITGINGNTWQVSRRNGRSHRSGTALWAECSAETGNIFWWFLEDPSGADTTNRHYFADRILWDGHRVTRDPYDIMEEYVIRVGPLTRTLNGPITFALTHSPSFAGAAGVARRERGEKVPVELRRAVPHQVDEQHHEHEQRREHDQKPDDHEQPVEQLAPADVEADLLEGRARGPGVHVSRPRGSGGSARSPRC